MLDPQKPPLLSTARETGRKCTAISPTLAQDASMASVSASFLTMGPHSSSQTLPLACLPGSILISLPVLPSIASSRGPQALHSAQTNWSVLQACSLCSERRAGPSPY